MHMLKLTTILAEKSGFSELNVLNTRLFRAVEALKWRLTFYVRYRWVPS